MEYEEIASKFQNGNKIKSLKDGIVREYSGHLSLIGIGEDAFGYDSVNKELLVYKGGILAEIVEQGVNKYEEHMRHIDNVLSTYERLGCTQSELLLKDYIKELKR